VTYLCNGP